VPLVFWNVVYLFGLWAVFSLDPDNRILGAINIDFGTAGLNQYINAGLALTQYPVGFHFWFVRDLFVTVLVSPLLWFVLRKAPLIGAGAFAAVWLAGFDLWIFFRPDVPFFFYVGGLLRQRRIRPEISWSATMTLLAIYVSIVALRALAPYLTGQGDSAWLDMATRAMRLVGVLACWGLFQHVALSHVGARVAQYAGYAFFLYAVHFPLIAVFKLVLWDFVPVETQAWMLAHYLACVVLTVGLGIGAGVLLARLAPKQFALLNGGRVAG
jgi:hypothetical protein